MKGSRMGVELIGFKEGNMGQHGGVTDDGDDDSNCSGDMDAFRQSLVQDDDGNFLEPHVGMEFDSGDAAKTFYEGYARNVGFSTRVHLDRSKTDGRAGSREFWCSRDGLKKRAGDTCGAMLRVELMGENKWVVTNFVKEHSHTFVGQGKLQYLRPKRHFAATTNNVVETFQGLDVVPSGVMYVSMDGNAVPTEMNHIGKNMTAPGINHTVKNVGSLGFTPGYSSRRRTLGRDAQNLLDYFKKMQAENPGFYYAIQLDEENRMANAFWADSRSRTAYSHFGDAVILDMTYRINQYRVPFAPFTGVNHHGQTILFGCALLLDESEATFVWLFKTFLAAMCDRAPVSLTTDKDRAIQAAVTHVFPQTRHCVNKWHVLREGQDRMAHVCLAHPNFQMELYNCVNMTDTIEEFESYWASILDKYDLKRNDWLQSIYDTRRQWVPVYFRDSFFAAVFPSPGYESSFFDGYVNQQTTLPMFFRQYERALENSFEREVEPDFDTMCITPVLKTPSPMEKQAASLYTERIFSKFQEELVETFVYTANRIDGDGHSSTYRVAKFEDDRKAYFVSLNMAEMKAHCSCRMFEYSGILCRHILTVFTVTNVLTLPPHYILKRWTRNAKSWVVADEQSELQGHESLTIRYNNLCKEAIRFAEEGAVSLETYNAALVSLREGGKKVADIKKSVAKVSPSSSQVSGVSYDDRKSFIANPEMTPLLWPRQDDVIRLFNLNDAGVHSQTTSDLNGPRMAPVSLGGHTDNMLMLPSLKSMTWVMENKNLNPAGVPFSAPLGSIYVKKRKKKSISGIRNALYRNFSVVPVRNFISGGGQRKEVPQEDDSCREAADIGCESNVQWASGKAGEDRVHVVVSEELGWLFVGIYDGFNGPDAPEFLMSHLYKAMYNELEGLFWDTEDAIAASSENADVAGNSYPSDVNSDDRQVFKEIRDGEVESKLVKKVMFGGEQIEVRRRRLWEYLVEDDPEEGLDLSGSERFAFSVDDALSVNSAGSAVSRRSLLLSKLKNGLLNRHKDKENNRLFPWRFWLEGKQKGMEEMRENNVADDGEVERQTTSRTDRKRKIGLVDHELVLHAMSRALEVTEQAYLDMTDRVLDRYPELALMGSCLLVVLMRDEDVYVMNVGDSRAIVAQYELEEEIHCGMEAQGSGNAGSNGEGIVEESAGVSQRDSKAVNEVHARESMSLTALQLSTDHSTSIEEEIIRIKNEHPDDRNCIVNDRVKGRLKVTRAFGAGFLKQHKWNDVLLEMFRNDYIGTAPYISCSPSLRHHKLCPRDQFLVLSSDGLYQYFSNEEVVLHVQNFIEKFPDGDPAQHLIEELLFRAARKAGMDFHELLDIPQGDRRKYHDDVTVMVVSLEGRIWKSSGKYL